MSLSARLRQDDLLSRVLLNSAHLFSSNSISLVLSFVQGVLATRLLGLADYGLVVIVMAYASTINGLFSFRMSELVVRYAGEYLEKGEKKRAGALIKAASIGEAAVSVLAFLLVSVTAGLATRLITKTPGTEWMIVFYSVGLLTNFNTETSTGILQIADKVRLRGVVNLIQSIISVSIIGAAFFIKGEAGAVSFGALPIVLGAYLAGKTVLGLGLFAAAQIQLRRVLGARWTKAPLSILPAARELREAARYYEEKAPGLGFDFIAEVRASIRRILAHPKRQRLPGQPPPLEFRWRILGRKLRGLPARCQGSGAAPLCHAFLVLVLPLSAFLPPISRSQPPRTVGPLGQAGPAGISRGFHALELQLGLCRVAFGRALRAPRPGLRPQGVPEQDRARDERRRGRAPPARAVACEPDVRRLGPRPPAPRATAAV